MPPAVHRWRATRVEAAGELVPAQRRAGLGRLLRCNAAPEAEASGGLLLLQCQWLARFAAAGKCMQARTHARAAHERVRLPPRHCRAHLAPVSPPHCDPHAAHAAVQSATTAEAKLAAMAHMAEARRNGRISGTYTPGQAPTYLECPGRLKTQGVLSPRGAGTGTPPKVRARARAWLAGMCAAVAPGRSSTQPAAPQRQSAAHAASAAGAHAG